jgi:hypothetical protein
MKIISVKEVVVVIILSFFVAFIADFFDGIINNTFIGGKSGFPFKDSFSLGFEGGESYPHMFLLNVLFWFFIILVIWKIFLHLKKPSKNSKR